MDRQLHPPQHVVVISAGPAGLTAAYELTTRGVGVVILEKDGDVGGLARIVEYKGFRFDIGGHRFFTKVGPVARFSNLQLLGRNSMHKYNNQDHSMLTAMLAVRNLFGERHNLWDVNADEEYHEEETMEPELAARVTNGRFGGQTQPAVPRLL